MRLSEDQKEAALVCSAHWMKDAHLVRVGTRWAVVGRYHTTDLDGVVVMGRKNEAWIGRLVVAVDDLIPELTWTAQCLGPTRKSVLEQLTANAT